MRWCSKWLQPGKGATGVGGFGKFFPLRLLR